MLYANTESTVRPEKVRVEKLGSGEAVVRLTDHVVEEVREDQTVFAYDEVIFTLESGRTETEEDILNDFDGWWAYGAQPEEPLPTIDERLELVEMILMGGMEP